MKVKIANTWPESSSFPFERYVGYLLIQNEKGTLYALPKTHYDYITEDLKLLGTILEFTTGFVVYDDGRVEAPRDGNGSLLCSGCKEPFPYAEPNGSSFTCYQCRNGL